MAKSALTITLRIEGIKQTLAAFRRLPKEASAELRKATLELSNDLATSARIAGRQEGRQAGAVSVTVKARRDRVPSIVAGGTKKLGRNRKPAYKLLFGSEFGANRLEQYKPHLGRGSYWFFKTVEEEQETIASAWNKAASEIVRAFGGNA